jgi:hypothetical protein
MSRQVRMMGKAMQRKSVLAAKLAMATAATVHRQARIGVRGEILRPEILISRRRLKRKLSRWVTRKLAK